MARAQERDGHHLKPIVNYYARIPDHGPGN